MSFRVKTTHKLLEPNAPPPPPTQNTFMNMLEDDEKAAYLPKNFKGKSQTLTTPLTRPKGSSNQGMAIRTIPTAQADHM